MRNWVGVYASPEEIRGFASMVLAINHDADGGYWYRMQTFSDVSGPGDSTDELRGEVLVDGNHVYLPVARGGVDANGTLHLSAEVMRYSYRRINGYLVLMSDDALAIYDREGKLWDYGVLVRMADAAGWNTDLGAVEHPSMKLLYTDPKKRWRDPFVHGPNEP